MSDPETELQGIAVVMAGRHAELTDELVRAFGERIPELPKDPALVELLHGSSGSNLETLAHLLRGHMPVSEIQAPAAAVEYARRLAQRGTSPSALLRAYRLGQQLVLAWATEEIEARVGDPLLALQTSSLLTQTSFEYVDAVSENVVEAYQEERERWLANRSAVQRETLEALLRDERLDLAAAESSLGYRLRQHHLALVLWTAPGAGDLAAAERTVVAIAERLGAGHPLFVPRDRETAWAWVPIGRAGEADLAAVDELVAAKGGGVSVAVGPIGAGEPGFRSSHLGAAAAQEVAQLGQHPAGRVIRHDDPTVRAAALLARDLPATRALVRRALGDLAEDTDGAARLRETLLAFVEERESYVATAARVHLHKNTVKYRVDRAIEARGKPLGEERLDLELALIACKWLAPEVLVRPGG
ncbi:MULTISPECIES: CdaR family transcriptional regulator [unclassified Nocardioides]|uniref:PucR family transcriptional regulator n=1 Tax=unclassified Nocardioides TaxID=2615069 RepID=UPI0011714F8F|nr:MULTISPECIES: helix-turn-helix domain-containing protein [unclassified Nocardioides]TQK69643.1 DNA-binding PucR family transcriptional regulator [Nocardioides sp. SLBN-35]WGY01115.1 helix-turn-helix domain-containing protein [Nocardioides sp. QY071]